MGTVRGEQPTGRFPFGIRTRVFRRQRATGTYNSLGVGRPSADRVHLLSGSVTEQGVRSDRVIATAPTGS